MSEHHITPLRTYLIIAATLLFLSGVTVWVSYVDLGALNIVVAMLVATLKASLVAFFFMHLLWDDKKNLTMFLMSLMFFGIFVTLFSDTIVFSLNVVTQPALIFFFFHLYSGVEL